MNDGKRDGETDGETMKRMRLQLMLECVKRQAV